MFIKRRFTNAKRLRHISFVCVLLCSIILLVYATFHIRIFSTAISGPYFNSVTYQPQRTSCVDRECTIEQASKHGSLFTSLPSSWSACYADFYLKAFDHHPTMVQNLLDIGANKAYTVSAWMAFFLPELGINQARLGRYLSSLEYLTYTCGSCDDCKDEPLRWNHTRTITNLQIHAFEPQPATADMLKGVQKWMNISHLGNLVFDVHGVAVSDHSGKTFFKKCNPGNEVCSLDVSKTSSDAKVEIDIVSLDDFADRKRLLKIDILKIDTEGYEPLVFRGAKRLLEEHRIRLFIFEYLKGTCLSHFDKNTKRYRYLEGAWLNTSLQIEVSKLTESGYICYMIGKTGLIRVSHCWNEQFNVRHCNLLCVSSKDRLLSYNIDRMILSGTTAITCRMASMN